MATQAQIQANRANARRSTGPRTPQGKAASAANALKHGLRAQRTVLPDENIEEFQALLSQYEQEFQPATAVEHTLVHQLADAEWRLRRIPRFEDAVLGNQLDSARRHAERYPERLPADPAALETYLLGQAVVEDARNWDVLTKLSRHESRLSRRYFKALDYLYRAQDRRQRRPAPTRSATKTETGQTNQIPATHPNNSPELPQPSAPAPTATENIQTNPIPSLNFGKPLTRNGFRDAAAGQTPNQQKHP